MDKIVGEVKLNILTDIEEVKEMFEKLANQNKRLVNALDEILDGCNVTDIQGFTGWSYDKCEEWFELLEEVKENKC